MRLHLFYCAIMWKINVMTDSDENTMDLMGSRGQGVVM